VLPPFAGWEKCHSAQNDEHLLQIATQQFSECFLILGGDFDAQG
jgi:hypothetical protein